ncbi:MAG: hypothetical protein ACTHKT_06335 [Solirubrobacterales bacterium]
MPPKPHRILLDRVSAYADEAAAYMRRRRVARRPFARLYYPNGRSADHAQDSKSGAELFVAAGRLIEVASERGARERSDRAKRDRSSGGQRR